MKVKFTLCLACLLALLSLVCAQHVMAQSVLDPTDPVVTYNPAAPPATPKNGVLAKWVRTVRMGYNTDTYKCYYYNGVQFRLKFPKSWTSAADGKKYPVYLFFHGVGELGTIYDNEQQLAHGGDVHMAAVDNGTFDGFLLYPQCSGASGVFGPAQWGYIKDIIMTYMTQVKADINRVTVDGLSGGGQSVWNFTNLYPNLVAAATPISSVQNSYVNWIPSLKWTSFWLFQGGLDTDPVPGTARQVSAAYNAAGASFKYTEYPNDGHVAWDDAWQEPQYYPFLNSVNKANPVVLHGKILYCTSDVISDTLGLTAGFSGYVWRKNGTVIPGATANTYVATSIGSYDCQILNQGTWSSFSSVPAVIGYQPAVVPPTITVNGTTSAVIPAPDGSTTAQLFVPTGFSAYSWQNVNSSTVLSTTNTVAGLAVGSYKVGVKDASGCSSGFSAPFAVINANGANAPAVPVSIYDSAISFTQVLIDWAANPNQTNPPTGYEVYQATSANGAYKLISVNPASQTIDTANGLTPNTTYYFKVRAISANGGSATVSASATTIGDFQPPSAPGNLRTGSVSPTSVQLVWDSAVDNVGIASYDIYVNGQKAFSIPKATTYTVYNLVNGQVYSFAVKARDLSGNVSPYSNQLSVTAAASGLTYNYYAGTWSVVPDFSTLTPVATGNLSNVSLSPAQSATNYAFMYTGFINIPVAGNYTFQTSSDDGSRLYIDMPYSAAATPTINNDGLHATQSVNSTTMNLSAGSHTFVATYFQQGGGAVMNVSWQTPQTGGQFVAIPDSAFKQTFASAGNPPTAPSGLVATAVTPKKITLSWTDNSSNETNFQLYRSLTPAGAYTSVGTVGPNVTSFSDSTLNPATTYYYKVTAINKYGTSKFNAQDSGLVTYKFYSNYTAGTLASIAGMTPASTGSSTNFSLGVTTATANFALAYNGYINIPVAGNYTFYTSSDDGSNLYIDSMTAAGLVVNNDGLHGTQEVSGTRTLTAGRHQIFVNFFQQGGGQVLTVSYAGPGIAKTVIPDSALTIPPANATTLPMPSLPLAPDSLNGNTTVPQQVSLTWANHATNATRIELYRSVGNGSSYSLDATLAPTATSFVDSNLSASTVYYYKVRAVNEAGNSNYSNVAVDTTIVNPVSTVTFPVLPSQTMPNDSTLNISLSATTDLGKSIRFTSTGLPAFATLTDNKNGTATISFTPNSTQLGTYNISVTATDNYGDTSVNNFTLTVNGKNMSTTYLNFNQSLPVPAPWNNMNAVPNAGTTLANLVDSKGNVTTATVTLLDAWSGYVSNGPTTGNNSGIFPDNVLKTAYYASNASLTYRVQLSGLSTRKKYSLSFYAGRVSTTPITANYTVGTQTVTLNCANNVANLVTISGISADSTGKIIVGVTKPVSSSNAFLGAMLIQAYDYDTTPPPPSALSAAGISTTSIGMNWTAPTDNARTGFEIWRSNAGGDTSSYTLYTTVGKNATSFVDSNLATNSTYYYKVRSIDAGTPSAFSNSAGGSTLLYSLELNMNSVATYAEASPWNNINTLLFNGFTLPNMINTHGDSTGINFNVTRNFSGYNTLGVTNANNMGVVPDTVMKTFYYVNAADTARFTISGLSQTSVYNFVFFGSSTFNQATNTIYKIGNQTVNLNALNNSTNTVQINGILPDSTGTVLVTIYSTTGYAYLTALMLQASPAPAAVGGSGTGLTARTNNVATGVARAIATDDSATVTQLNTSLKVYPNPFTGNVVVKFDFKENVGKFTLVVMDVSGRMVKKFEYANLQSGYWQQTVDLSSLPHGLYFMQVMGIPNEKYQPFKLIKIN
jgi:pimeloyl-ACP methyl ester carboxylesterase